MDSRDQGVGLTTCVAKLSEANRRSSKAPLQRFDFLMPKASHQMIIHHPYRLHEGVNNRWTAKIEPALLEVFRHATRYFGFCLNVRHAAGRILNDAAIGKSPEIVRKSLFLLNIEVNAPAFYSALDFTPMADNTSIRHKAFNFFGAISDDPLSIETVEGGPKILALS